MSAEQTARKTIDELLGKAGWHVCDFRDADIHASRGVAIREFPLGPSTPARAGEGRGEGGYADYLLYVDGKAAGIIEASLRREMAPLVLYRATTGAPAPSDIRRSARQRHRARRACRAS